MRYGIFFLLLFLQSALSAQRDSQLNAYLESIRDNPAELTAFFHQMPKGGDLHHHYSGSIYAETFIAEAVRENLWINTASLAVQQQKPDPQSSGWTTFSQLLESGEFPDIRERLLRHWSDKDYRFQPDLPQDQHFFATFGRFDPVQGSFSPEFRDDYAAGLMELKNRALSENVQYIETMFARVKCPGASIPDRYNAVLWDLQQHKNRSALHDTLAVLYNRIESSSRQCAASYNAMLSVLHDSLEIDDQHFAMRYQTYVIRTLSPASVFAQLVASFMAAENSDLVVGVNIVAPENDPVSMRDYWLHMQMFRFLHPIFPNVRYAMHAGELVLGMVPPEQLTWHIREAVLEAGARRIGHGVDISWEQDCYSLLDSMRQRDVAVEINLTSNEFILGVKDGYHPISLYHHFGVPIVISTDDAGVLRSNLSEQYVLLASRYPEFSYTDIRALVFNSVHYSFVENNALKASLLARLEAQFGAFEARVLR